MAKQIVTLCGRPNAPTFCILSPPCTTTACKLRMSDRSSRRELPFCIFHTRAFVFYLPLSPSLLVGCRLRAILCEVFQLPNETNIFLSLRKLCFFLSSFNENIRGRETSCDVVLREVGSRRPFFVCTVINRDRQICARSTCFGAFKEPVIDDGLTPLLEKFPYTSVGHGEARLYKGCW